MTNKRIAAVAAAMLFATTTGCGAKTTTEVTTETATTTEATTVAIEDAVVNAEVYSNQVFSAYLQNAIKINCDVECSGFSFDNGTYHQVSISQSDSWIFDTLEEKAQISCKELATDYATTYQVDGVKLDDKVLFVYNTDEYHLLISTPGSRSSCYSDNLYIARTEGIAAWVYVPDSDAYWETIQPDSIWILTDEGELNFVWYKYQQ